MTGAVRYQITHVSRYRYTTRVRQCAMLLCLEPREDRRQRLLHFEIETHPPGFINREKDSFGNARHVLDVQRAHRILEITARSTVESMPPGALPERLDAGVWDESRALRGSFADWDFVQPSALVAPSPALAAFVDRHRIEPGSDPLDKPVATLGYAPPPPALHFREPLRWSPPSIMSSGPTEESARTTPT